MSDIGTGQNLRGEVVYIFAYDLAYDMEREPVAGMLGQEATEYVIYPSKRSPKYQFFYRPRYVELPPHTVRVGEQEVPIRRMVKLFNIGALSFQIRVPFEVRDLTDLVAYHDLEIAGTPLETHARELAERLREELAPYCIRPVDRVREGEAYTVFCLDRIPAADTPDQTAEHWFQTHRRTVAGLLTQEENPDELSDQEADESAGRYLSYYNSDLTVVDWDAALVAGMGPALDEVLHVMELANVQLVELGAYDQILDRALEASYRHMSRSRFAALRREHRSLREIRVDLACLSDELVNITKFFGDWHLAKIHENLSERFHLGAWHQTIDDKVTTLAGLYGLLQQDRTNLIMIILEAMIVLLFIVDLVPLFLQALRGLGL